MSMSKNRIRRIIVIAILAGVFNVMAFIIPFEHTKCFWVSYAFAMLAILIQELLWIFGWEKSKSLKSKFMGIPVLQLGIVYLVIQVVVSLIFMSMAAFTTYKAPLVIDVILLAVFLILFVFVDIGRDVIGTVDEKVKEKTFYIASLQTDIELLIPLAKESELQKQLKDLAESIRYSDPMSSDAVASVENKIERKVNELGEVVRSGNQSDAATVTAELELLIAERNKKVRMLKM